MVNTHMPFVDQIVDMTHHLSDGRRTDNKIRKHVYGHPIDDALFDQLHDWGIEAKDHRKARDTIQLAGKFLDYFF